MPRPNVSAKRKAQILQAAERVFAREGLTNARMEQIAAEAGLSVGILYWYFEDKDDLIYQLLVNLTEQDLATYPSLLQAPGSVRQKLEQMFVHELERSLAIAPLFYSLYARALVTPEMRAHLQTYYAQYLAAFTALIEQGIAQGEFRPMDAAAAGYTILALYMGLLETATLCETQTSNAQVRFAEAVRLLLDSWRCSQKNGVS